MASSDFTGKELQYLADTDFLLTKKSIIEKAIAKLQLCSEAIDKEVLKGTLPINEKYLVNSPKISRGENYRDLPYLVLDNPRYYTREEVVAYRIVFWWGNHLSFSLHLQGPEGEVALSNLLAKREYAEIVDIWYCMGNSPWEYHFESSNYQKLKELKSNEIESHFNRHGFLKVTKRATLDEWPRINDLSIKNLKILSDLISPDRQS